MTETPADRVEVVTAAGEDPSGVNPLVWIALLATLAAAGWWLIAARRRRDEDEVAEQPHQG